MKPHIVFDRKPPSNPYRPAKPSTLTPIGWVLLGWVILAAWVVIDLARHNFGW